MKNLKIFTLGLLLFLIQLSLFSQITISPPYVSIDGKSGVGNIFLTNNSALAQECEISFMFGYPASDSAGNLVMNYTDSVAYKQFALDPVVKAFPRSFVLQGKQQRTIRVQVKPQPGMKDGFYFTRAKILAKQQTPEVAKQGTEAISTKITYSFEQVIPAFYRRGKLTTGLKIDAIKTFQKDSILSIITQLDRLGDAPFIGSILSELKDEKGNVLATNKTNTTAYFNVLRKVEMNIAKVPAGSYKLEITFETKRNDMAIDDLIQAPSISETIPVTIK